MTKIEKLKYKRWCRKETNVNLIKELSRLEKESLGSVAEEMFEQGYPPDMVYEQYKNEKDDEWCLKEIYKELKRRGVMVE